MKRIETRHARRPFTATRDEAGVPQVTADSFRTAIYALGYLHAIDRPTQLLFSRTVAMGAASDQINDRPRLRDTDRFFRRAGLYLRLEEEVRLLDDETFELLTIYCEGVNDGLKDSGRSLPMRATGFRPELWNQQAVMLVGILLSFGGLAVGQQQNERLLLELIQLGIHDERLRELFAPLLDDADLPLLRQVKLPLQLSDEALELITDLPRLAGSNAWAVSPRRSASGSALLASDPHLEVNRLPAIWYEATLRWGDDYVMGATLPGCPLFAVARTPRVAWGVTYLKGDTSDLFIEDCRTGGATGWQYRRGDDWHDFRLRLEEIQHKDGPGETLRIYSNDVGTLEGNIDETGPGLHLSVSWVGHAPGTGAAIGTWLKVIPCKTAAEGMDVVRRSPQPTLCWLFADREGHIGRQASGWFPRRPRGYSGALPIPAWDVANHWQGWLPESVLPRVFDPPEGFVASANENINPPLGPRLVTLPVPEYRKRRIVERLRELPQATVEDMQQLQYDVVSTQARDLLGVFLPHLPEGKLKQRLAAWDFSYGPESYEATLFQRLYRNVILETFGESRLRDGGLGWRRVLYLCSRVGYSTMVLTAVDRVLMKEQSSWWRGRDKGELIRRAAVRLELEAEQPWGQFNSFRMINRFFEQAHGGRVLGFKSGELPMPGCHATPFQGHLLRSANREETFAPSYHFVTDLATDEAWTNLPGGPSESRFSKYYRSDVGRWFAGEYKRLAPPQ